MCQIPTLALNQTTGESGMRSPYTMIGDRYSKGNVLLGTAADKDSDLGQKLEACVIGK